MTARTRATVPLGRFLSAISDRIATMPAEELREVVLAFAESVEASDRAGFLQRFCAAPARHRPGPGSPRRGRPDPLPPSRRLPLVVDPDPRGLRTGPQVRGSPDGGRRSVTEC
jgi:hypothetical protein